MASEEAERIVCLAKLAEVTERYGDMTEAMKALTKLGEPLTTETRNLLSVAYKNSVGARRASWSVVRSIEEKKEGSEHTQSVVLQYRLKIQKEIEDVCKDMLELLSTYLVPSVAEPINILDYEAKVFYLKMKGDYYRYLSEVALEHCTADVMSNSMAAYEEAVEVAETNLKSTNPIRLGLALNFSVFYYEIVKNSDEACRVAKRALDDSMEGLSFLPEDDNYKDSILIMHLLKENLDIWTVNNCNDNEQDGRVD